MGLENRVIGRLGAGRGGRGENNELVGILKAAQSPLPLLCPILPTSSNVYAFTRWFTSG
jgi:hypothetical protein